MRIKRHAIFWGLLLVKAIKELVAIALLAYFIGMAASYGFFQYTVFKCGSSVEGDPAR